MFELISAFRFLQVVSKSDAASTINFVSFYVKWIEHPICKHCFRCYASSSD